jgi:hypothetical protein
VKIIRNFDPGKIIIIHAACPLLFIEAALEKLTARPTVEYLI